jgi:hypothetical protein
MLVTMTEARLACLSTTWSPQQRLHPGNLAWAHARGDGSPAPTGTLSWGDPLAGFADVWVDASGEGPAEVSMHVTPRASPEAASRFLAELLEAWPELHVEVSTEDRVLLPALQAAGFRVDPGPWFVQLWRRVDDLATSPGTSRRRHTASRPLTPSRPRRSPLVWTSIGALGRLRESRA